MSHEQSETIQGRDKRWYNTYGQGTGADQPMPLPQLFNFEQSNYTTAEEAANKAAWRSHLGEGHYPTQPPQYGFTNTYQPSPQAMAFGHIVEALMDPRNAWMGLGGIGRFGRLTPRMMGPRQEMGGFNVPTSQMKRDYSDIRVFDNPMTEGAARTDYLRYLRGVNQDAEMMTQAAPYNRIGREAYELSDPSRQVAIDRTIRGRRDLRNEMERRIFGFTGEHN